MRNKNNMKLKLNNNKTKRDDSKIKDFDELVQELRDVTDTGCCSDQNACDLRCSPLNGGCNSNEDGGCC